MQCTWVIPKPSTPTPGRGKTVYHEISPWCPKGWGPLSRRNHLILRRGSPSSWRLRRSTGCPGWASGWWRGHTEMVWVHLGVVCKTKGADGGKFQKRPNPWGFRKPTTTTALDFSSSMMGKGQHRQVWVFFFLDSLKSCWFGGRVYIGRIDGVFLRTWCAPGSLTAPPWTWKKKK